MRDSSVAYIDSRNNDSSIGRGAMCVFTSNAKRFPAWWFHASVKVGWCAVLLALTLGARSYADPPAVSLHPENPRYLLFRGEPRVLVTATEHYGAVINRPFDYIAYLDDAAARKHTLTRLFLLYRELQTPRNPYSTCKPESTDFIAPWPRTGPGAALDMEPKFDLDQWNPEYFERLHGFLRAASERGIIVELTLLSCTYHEPIWALNPLRAENNLQGIGRCALQDYISLKDEPLVEKQLEFVRKVVAETCAYDHVYYETCNEPIGGFPNAATQQEVDAWQAKIAQTIRSVCREAGRPHLVFGYHAASTLPEIKLDASFDTSLFDGVNYHPAISGPVTLRGKQYYLGRFMAGDKTLAALRDFALAAHELPKPCVNDEDNAAASRRDERGWVVDRQRAWVTIMCGGHYDVIDFSITIYTPQGTRLAGEKLRAWIGHLSEFIHAFDFVHARPVPEFVIRAPKSVLTCTLAVGDEQFATYFADARELNADPAAGQPLQGDVALKLPPGIYVISFYSPESGLSSPGVRMKSEGELNVSLPSFQHDLVLRAERIPTAEAAEKP